MDNKGMKAEEMLTRGKGNFINCTDYDDAIKAMKEYSSLQIKEAIEEIEKNFEWATGEEEVFVRTAYKQCIEILNSKINGK